MNARGADLALRENLAILTDVIVAHSQEVVVAVFLR
jgi:hypothetical protein